MTNKKENFTTITFPSKDGLQLTADYYKVKNPKGFILLCHRSHCNRGEYRETAPKLNMMGYSCLAIDQRSGMNVFGVINETKKLAKLKKLSTGYLDANQDIEAAIDFCYKLNGNKLIFLLGSSYSASLSLLISGKTKKVKASIVFSPSECLKGISLFEEIKQIDIPIFATSPLKEIEQVTDILKNIDKRFVTHFIPKVEGFHGSKTLWDEVKGNESYWEALEEFLKEVSL